MATVGKNFCLLCQDESHLHIQAALSHFYWLLFSASQTVVLLLQQTLCIYTVIFQMIVCAHVLCVFRKLFPSLFARLMCECAFCSPLRWEAEREIVFRLCLLFPISGQYAHSRCQPSCCVLVWCLHCMAANHAALSLLLYPAVMSSAGNPAMSQLQQRGSLDRVRSDKIPLWWIFSATEDRQSGGYEHALSKTLIWEVLRNT